MGLKIPVAYRSFRCLFWSTLYGTPTNNDGGALSIKVTASDGLSSVSDTFNLKVNRAPVVANAIADQLVDVGTSLNFSFAANTFSDLDGDTLTYSATLSNGNPLPAWLIFTPATRTFSGTPTNNDGGTLSFKVTASDGVSSTSAFFNIITLPAASPAEEPSSSSSSSSWIWVLLVGGSGFALSAAALFFYRKHREKKAAEEKARDTAEKYRGDIELPDVVSDSYFTNVVPSTPSVEVPNQIGDIESGPQILPFVEPIPEMDVSEDEDISREELDLYDDLDSASVLSEESAVSTASSQFYSTDKMEIAQKLAKRIQEYIPCAMASIKKDQFIRIEFDDQDGEQANQAVKKTLAILYPEFDINDKAEEVVLLWRSLDAVQVRRFKKFYFEQKNEILQLQQNQLLEHCQMAEVEKEKLKAELDTSRLALQASEETIRTRSKNIERLEELHRVLNEQLNTAQEKGDDTTVTYQQAQLRLAQEKLTIAHEALKESKTDNERLKKQNQVMVEQVLKGMNEMHQKVDHIDHTVVSIESRQKEEMELEKKIQRREEKMLRQINAQLEQMEGSSSNRSPEEELLIAELIQEKAEQNAKAALRNKYLYSKQFPQLRTFYLVIQKKLNVIFMSSGLLAEGLVAGNESGAAQAIQLAGEMIPIPGARALGHLSAAILRRRQSKKEKQKAKACSDFFTSTKEAECLAEEIALKLCQQYEEQLSQVAAGPAAREGTSGIDFVAEAAIARIIKYLTAREEPLQDPVNDLVQAVRIEDIKAHKKVQIETVVPRQKGQKGQKAWSVFGIFSQSGIRTTTPRRRPFANEPQQPTSKRHDVRMFWHTDVKNYGYANGDELSAVKAGMSEHKP